MKKTTLKKEGEKWVDEGIITKDQLEQLLSRYPERDFNVILLIFAVLLTGIGFLTFVFSDWAQEPHFSRILIIVFMMVALYGVGEHFYRKSSDLLGVSFITLGYIVFGAGMLLGLYIYEVQVLSPWPFVIWSLVGLALYFIYEHRFLFIVSILVVTAGQVYASISFSMFCWLLLLILLFGFGHFVYHHRTALYSYAFGVSFLIQMTILTAVSDWSFYWIIVLFLLPYLLSELVKDDLIKIPLRYSSLLGIFIYNIYQVMVLQDVFFKDINLEVSFLIVWIVLFLLAIFLKNRQMEKYTYVDLILFLPVVYILHTSVLTLIILFVFSLSWLFIGYKLESNEHIVVGTISFLFSTFTAYIQYAWDTMNKSLFFLVGGALLFILSALLERQRRTIVNQGGKK